jgi:hypothetical protein
MCLNFGHKAFAMVLPFAKQHLRLMLDEPKRSHPAIKLELRFHYLFGFIFVLCLSLEILHALIPHLGNIFLPWLVSSLCILVLLTIVSLVASIVLP